jgi:hypothetical protein
MSALQTMTEDLALQMLARDGVAVIWRLPPPTPIAPGILNPRRRLSTWQMRLKTHGSGLWASGGFHRCCWTSS